jgi:hypothetical protein
MNHRITGVIFTFIFLTGPITYAKASSQTSEEISMDSISETSTSISDHPQAISKMKLSASLQTANFKYVESKMTDTDQLSGVLLQLDLPVANPAFYMSGQLEMLSGTGTYDGQFSDGTPLKTENKDTITTLRGLFGYQTELNDSNMLVPFAGLGLRYLVNIQSGPGSYKREINYSYLPVGVALRSQITSNFSTELQAEYDVFLAGTATSHLSDVSSNYPDVQNEQTSGSGYRVSAHFKWNFGNFMMGIQPFLQNWKVANSNEKYIGYGRSVYEPENETTMTGANLSVSF